MNCILGTDFSKLYLMTLKLACMELRNVDECENKLCTVKLKQETQQAGPLYYRVH